MLFLFECLRNSEYSLGRPLPCFQKQIGGSSMPHLWRLEHSTSGLSSLDSPASESVTLFMEISCYLSRGSSAPSFQWMQPRSTSGWKVFALKQQGTVHFQSSRVSHVYVGTGNFPWPDSCLGWSVEKPWRQALWKHPFNLRGICSGLWINFVRNSVFKGQFQFSSSPHSIANVYLRAAWRVNSLFF